MKARFGTVVLECLFDLGVTIVYAIIVGMLIVAVVASDDGPISVLRAGLYVAILPAGVAALIAAEIGVRLLKDWRSGRLARAFPAQAQGAGRLSLPFS